MFSIHFYGSTESQTQTVPLVPIQTTITMSFCFISWVAQQEENAVRVEFPWQDYLCLKCYGDLHSKGFRKSHAPFCLVPCALCVVLPVPRTWRNSGHSGKGQGREIDIWYGSWGWVKTYYCHIWGHKHPLTRILGYLVCQGFDLYGWKLGTTNKKRWSILEDGQRVCPRSLQRSQTLKEWSPVGLSRQWGTFPNCNFHENYDDQPCDFWESYSLTSTCLTCKAPRTNWALSTVANWPTVIAIAMSSQSVLISHT